MRMGYESLLPVPVIIITFLFIAKNCQHAATRAASIVLLVVCTLLYSFVVPGPLYFDGNGGIGFQYVTRETCGRNVERLAGQWNRIVERLYL